MIKMERFIFGLRCLFSGDVFRHRRIGFPHNHVGDFCPWRQTAEISVHFVVEVFRNFSADGFRVVKGSRSLMN